MKTPAIKAAHIGVTVAKPDYLAVPLAGSESDAYRITALERKYLSSPRRLTFTFPSLAWNDPGIFSDSDELAGGEILELLDLAAGPVNFQISSDLGAEAKVETGIAGRQITGLAEHLLRLNPFPIARHHSGSYSAPV